MNKINEIYENLQKGRSDEVKRLTAEALTEGIPAETILQEALLEPMAIVREKFDRNEVYLTAVLIASKALDAGIEILKPHLSENQGGVKGRVCIGTVRGDLHDIGKNLVKTVMEGKGLEVIDLGTDVAPEDYVNAAIEHECQLICCSAVLTTTKDVMREVVEAATAAGIRDKVKIMIGGAPITEEYCKQIGADKYTPDAVAAANEAVKFCVKKD